MNQRIMMFVSNNRDHAAIWTLMEFVTNAHDHVPLAFKMEDREGQWWLVSRDLFNTKEQALDSLLKPNRYYGADETITFLFDKEN